MTSPSNTVPLRALVGALLLAASSLATAQYMWIDDKGLKQFSDRPPPPNVPDKRILKAPGKPPFNPNAAAQVEDAPAAEPAEAKRPPTLAERNADFNKRKADAAANCDGARKNQMALDQGIRMSSYDKNGERGVMGDQEREELRKKTQKVLADCK
jgi:hypothetical protein